MEERIDCLSEICKETVRENHKILMILIWRCSQSSPKSTEKETFLTQKVQTCSLLCCKMYREDLDNEIWEINAPFVLLTQECLCHAGMGKTSSTPKRASLISLPWQLGPCSRSLNHLLSSTQMSQKQRTGLRPSQFDRHCNGVAQNTFCVQCRHVPDGYSSQCSQ